MVMDRSLTMTAAANVTRRGCRARRGWRWLRASRIGVLVFVAAATLAACSGSSQPSSSGSAGGPGQIQRGGTAYYSELAGAPPDWIFPVASLTYYQGFNIGQFQYLMYRPLYWFGQITTTAPTVDYTLSFASAPVFSNGGKTVTINLKGWKFSNGQIVDAQSVIFWLNMLKAEKNQYGAYTPGLFPDNVASYSTPGPTSLTVTLNLTEAFSSEWYLNDQLSQITPMPEAWDITSLGGAPGSGGCGKVASGPMTGAATMAACKAVWAFDTDDNGQAKNPKMAGDTSTYGTNPAWKVVDGPWTLSAYNSSNGEATFVPNKAYSGPQRPYLAKFVELPYTSDTTEFSALAAGGAGAPDVGYIPLQDVPANHGKLGSVGANNANVAGSFSLVPLYDWAFGFTEDNFQSTGDDGQAGPIFSQLYIRQALQLMINQPEIVTAFDHGYGVPTYGPVPIYPANPYASTTESDNPYPPNTAKAISLLTSHGWQVNKGGTDVCVAAAGCGAGTGGVPAVKKGARLQFTELVGTGITPVTDAAEAIKSAWSSIGINVSLKLETYNVLDGATIACQYSQGSKCSWELSDEVGFVYTSPQPSGGPIFATGAASNSMSYSSSTADNLIEATEKSNAVSAMKTYENYLAEQLPVIWEPFPVLTLAEVSDRLGGVTPLNPLITLTPEYWYFKKS